MTETRISTARWYPGDTGWARVLSVPKFGGGNTPGVPLPTSLTNVFRVRLGRAGNAYSANVIVTLKNWNPASSTYAAHLTATTTTPRGLEIAIEDDTTNNLYTLLVRHAQNLSFVTVDTVGDDTGFSLLSYANSAYNYVPAGGLITPTRDDYQSTGSTGSTGNQWIQLGSVNFRTASTEVSRLLAFWDKNAKAAGDAFGLLSIQARSGALGTAPTVSVQVVDPSTTGKFTFYTRVTAGGGSDAGTLDVFVNLNSTFSQLATASLAASADDGANGIAWSSWPTEQTPSTTVPSGTLVAAANTAATHGVQSFTSSGTFQTVPGVKYKLRVVGPGGPGAGAGSASTAIAQVGGGGGGAGGAVETEFLGDGTTLTYTIGNRSAAGVGGASGGAVGTQGTVGTSSSASGGGLAGIVSANSGGAGSPSAANSTTVVGGGQQGRGASTTTSGIPGTGGPSGQGSVPTFPGLVGGSGGGASSTTLGGGGGSASILVSGVSAASTATPTAAASGTATGVDGTTALTPGCGGGGGGGGANGGAGGNGGQGGPGGVIISW